jgi:hypothetical protein
MNNHKATLEQWAIIEDLGRVNDYVIDSCLLELRARVEALEDQASNYPETPDSSTPPTVATDEELMDTMNRVGTTWIQDIRSVYNLGAAHEAARWRNVAEPAPVAGEAEELVAELRAMATDAAAACQFCLGETLTRAANMLQQLSEQEAGQ